MPSSDDEKDSHQLSMLFAEIYSAEAMMAAAKVASDPTSLKEFKESTLQTYQGCLQLVLRTRMSHAQETQVWNRLAQVRHWLEVTGLLKR